MTNENELALRMKFYMAPKSTTYEQLVEMNKKFTSYPGLTLQQAQETAKKLEQFKYSL